MDFTDPHPSTELTVDVVAAIFLLPSTDELHVPTAFAEKLMLQVTLVGKDRSLLEDDYLHGDLYTQHVRLIDDLDAVVVIPGIDDPHRDYLMVREELQVVYDVPGRRGPRNRFRNRPSMLVVVVVLRGPDALFVEVLVGELED